MSTILEVQNLKKYFQTPHGQLSQDAVNLPWAD